MTDEDLIKAGFKRVDVTAEESGDPNDWHYYEYYFDKYLSLIAYRDDDAEPGIWCVDFFEAENIRFTNIDNVVNLIWPVENARVK